LFTANPLSGARDEFVITANWGIGESVVADMTPPDTLIVGAACGSVLSTTVASKKVMVALVPEGKKKDENKKRKTKRKKTEKQTKITAPSAAAADSAPARVHMAQAISMPVPLAKQDTLCLTTDAVRQLWELGNNVQQHYGGEPQDIEWAVGQDGRVVLLQARPVTTLKQPPSSSSSSSAASPEPTVGEFDTPHVNASDWITTCNAQEMFPGAGTPLTISIFGTATEYAMQMLHVDFGMMSAPDPSRPRLAWASGHIFINMTNTFYMLTQMVGGTMGKANGEMSILGRINDQLTMAQLCEAAGGSPWLPRRVFNSMRYLYAIAGAEARIAEMKARADSAPGLLRGDDGDDSDDVCAMYRRIVAFRPEYNQQWADGVMCGSTSAAWMLLVMKLVVRDRSEMWSTQRCAEISAALKSPTSKVESADAVKKLDALKALIVNHPDAHLFAVDWRGDAPRALAWMSANRGGAGEVICDAFAQLLARHGHRCVKEAEFRNEDWGESPDVLVKLLQSGVAALLKVRGCEGAAMAEGVVFEHDEPREDPLVELLREEWAHVGCVWRPLLRAAVGAARDAVARREMGKSLQVLLHSHLKRTLRHFGRALVDRALLPEVDLMYFLSLEELGVLCGAMPGGDTGALRMRAIKRRRLFPTQERFRFADLGQGTPSPLPRAPAAKNVGAGFRVVGTPVSNGVVEGYARVCRSLSDANELLPGEILVCPYTDVGVRPFCRLMLIVVFGLLLLLLL
jgi:hypothetical protein